jgi:aspartate racemase
MGGMGPAATVDFMSKVIALTPAAKDQDHIRMLVDNNPGVPDRQVALTGDGEDPGPVLVAMAKGLEKGGADFLVMPCNTAHAWADAIRDAVTIPLVSIIDETVAACADYETVGLLSTAGCLRSNVYQAGFEAAGKQLVLPSDDEVAEIMELVFRVKAGDLDDEVCERMASIANSLADRGANVVVAACTEIPLVLRESLVRVPVVNSTDVLAATTVARARSG